MMKTSQHKDRETFLEKGRMASMFNPPHPGLTLRDDVLPALGLSVTQAAQQLDVSRVALSRVLNGRAAISPEMALRIEAWLGVERGGEARLWLAEQSAYDVWQAEQRFKVNPMHVQPAPAMVAWATPPENDPSATLHQRRSAPMNMHDPAAPGELLQGWLEDLNTTVTAFAAHIGISRVMLSRVLHGHAAVTADMDLRLSEALGTSPGYWLALQTQRDLWVAHQSAKARPVISLMNMPIAA
jgi:addiction module HigA family antidote